MISSTCTRMLMAIALAATGAACTMSSAGYPILAIGDGASGSKSSPYDKPGFVTEVVDGRLWVFRPDSPELEQFRAIGEPAKHVIRPGAGPSGMTVKAPDGQTVQAYVAARPGFETFVEDGRIWVFKPGSTELTEYKAYGEPAKHIIRPGAGPLGMTVKAPDAETVSAYLGAGG